MTDYLNQITDVLSSAQVLVQNTMTRISTAFTEEQLKNSGKIYLLGNGTAYAAALALKDSFMAYTDWTGNWIYPMTERNFAYEVSDSQLSFGHNFVIQLHCSDSDAETTTVIRQRCASSNCLSIDFCSQMGEVGSFMQLFIQGVCMALCIGAAQAKLSKEQVQTTLCDLYDYAQAQLNMLPDTQKQCAQIATEIATSSVRNFETIGTGLDYATAWLIRLLLYRKTGRVTTVEESEDYLHVNSLNVNPSCFATFVINSADNPAYDRTLLTIGNVQRIGRFGVVLTDANRSDIDTDITVIALAGCTNYPLKGLCSFIPAALIAGELNF